MDFHNFSCKLNHDDLQTTNDEPNDNEKNIVKDIGKNVKFVIDFSGTNHIDDLEPDEYVKDKSQVPRGSLLPEQ